MSISQREKAPDVHNAHLMVDGMVVSADITRVIRAIKEYEPELDVRWIPPAARKMGEAAFAIIHDAPGNAPYIMFYVDKEENFDDRVLLKIIANDQREGKRHYSEIEAVEATKKRMDHQIFLDYLEEKRDIVKHVLDSKLNDYKVSKELRIKEGIPFNVVGTEFE